MRCVKIVFSSISCPLLLHTHTRCAARHANQTLQEEEYYIRAMLKGHGILPHKKRRHARITEQASMEYYTILGRTFRKEAYINHVHSAITVVSF